MKVASARTLSLSAGSVERLGLAIASPIGIAGFDVNGEKISSASVSNVTEK